MLRLVPVAVLLLLSIYCFSQSGDRPVVAKKVTLNGDQIPLLTLAELVVEGSSFGGLYDSSIFPGNPTFSIHSHDLTLASIFQRYFVPLRIHKILKGKTFHLERPEAVTIYKLHVTDNEGKFLTNASVTILQEGEDPVDAMTDDLGLLPFAVLPAPFTLRVSCIGYGTVEKKISDTSSFLPVVLKSVYNDLDIVSVTGYTTLTPRSSTGSSGKVKLSESEKESNDNIQEALKGTVTGLSITDVNGTPGSGQTIRIRGRNSIFQSNSPLVVIDGIPLYLGSPGAVNAGAPTQGLAGLSPLSTFSSNMIGAATVLKDPSSTALYGSRGSNGVILFNTLIDTAGKERWSLNFSTGASVIVPIQTPLSTRNYLNLRKTAISNDGLPIDSTSLPEAYLWDSTRYTNFKKQLIGNPGIQYDLNGRFLKKNRAGYLVMNGWLHRETSVFSGQPSDTRASVSAHFLRRPANHHYALQGSAMYTHDDLNLPANDMTRYIGLTPNTPSPYGSNGAFAYQLNDLHYTNIEAMKQNTYKGGTEIFFTHLQFMDTLGRQLVLKLSSGFNDSRIREKVALPASAQDPASNPFSVLNTNKTEYNTFVIEPMIEYRWRFSRKDSLEALLGFNWQEQFTSLSYLRMESGSNIPVNPDPDPLNSRLVYRYEAGFGRLHYSHDSLYMVDLSLRRDGSSRFGPDRQFGNFGAIGMGWVFSRSGLLKKSKWLNWGKLKANYGTVGNDQIGDYQYLSLWNVSNNGYGYLGAPALTSSTADNRRLGWEVQHQLEGGVDLGLLHNRILFSAVYYYHWSGNQIVLSGLSGQTGLSTVLTNIPARIINKGLEIEATIHMPTGRNWQWTMSATLTIPENKLASFPGLGTSSYANQFTIGKSLTEVIGYMSTGVSRDSGLFTFLGKPGGKVITTIGNIDLRYYGGFANNITVGPFSLDLLLEFRNQNGVSPFTQIYRVVPPGMSDPSGLVNPMIDPHWYWKKPGDHALLQKPTATVGTAAWSTIDTYTNSSAQITNASFIRLKTVAVGVRLGKGFLRRFGCTEGKVFAEAKNILTRTNYPVTDPETQSPFTMPPLRTIRIGFHVKF